MSFVAPVKPGGETTSSSESLPVRDVLGQRRKKRKRRRKKLMQELREYTLYCESRKFSGSIRRKYASSGVALPDGSFPIPDVDALHRAIQAIGRAGAGKRAKVMAHIKRRARALGATSALPSSWGKAATQEFDDSDPWNDGDHDFWSVDHKPTAMALAFIKKCMGAEAADMSNRCYWQPDGTPTTELEGALKGHIQNWRDYKSDPSMAPAAQGPVNQEGTPLEMAITLERGDIPGVTVLQEPEAGANGVMRMRVPFYVGGSVSRASGFSKKILWQEKTLPQTVASMKANIEHGLQPLTVYARHAHALDHAHLPVGSITDVTQEGRIGYATLEIEPTSEGRDLQILAAGRKINAVSLRAAPGNYKLRAERVNGEEMLVCEQITPDGIDFAPDGPAQPTFGIEMLNEEPKVEPIVTIEPVITNSKETSSEVELTLEGLRESHLDLVQAIEAPLNDKIEGLKAERKDLRTRVETLEQEKVAADKAAYVETVGAHMSQEAKAALVEFAGTVKTKEEVAVKVAEILVQAQAAAAVDRRTPAEKLASTLFPQSGSGQTVTAEEPAVDLSKVDVLDTLPL